MDGNWEKLDAQLRALLGGLLEPGEELVGCLTATARKTFSATPYAIGVTPGRLIMVPVDRRFAAKGPVDGFGGGLAHFLTADLGDIRLDTADQTYKLMALGGGMDQLITGTAQRDGKQAFLEFLHRARHPAG